MDEPLTVKCPRCRKSLTWSKDNPYRPFCSSACKTMDLADWADGRYKLSRTLTQDDEEIINLHP